MKNENHKKVIYFEDFGQFGGVHPTPEVKICLHTKFELNRRELENISKLKIWRGGRWRGSTPPPPQREWQDPPPPTQGKGRIPPWSPGGGREGRPVHRARDGQGWPGLARVGQGWPGMARVGQGWFWLRNSSENLGLCIALAR